MRKYAYPVSGKTHYSDLTNVSYGGKLPVGVLNGNQLVAQNVQNQKLQRSKLSKIQTVQMSGFLPEIRVALILTCYPEIPR